MKKELVRIDHTSITKLNEIKRRQKKKGLSDGVYIVLALDEYLTTIEETYFI